MTSLEDIGFRSFVARDVVGAVAVSSGEMWLGGAIALGAALGTVYAFPKRFEVTRSVPRPSWDTRGEWTTLKLDPRLQQEERHALLRDVLLGAPLPEKIENEDIALRVAGFMPQYYEGTSSNPTAVSYQYMAGPFNRMRTIRFQVPEIAHRVMRGETPSEEVVREAFFRTFPGATGMGMDRSQLVEELQNVLNAKHRASMGYEPVVERPTERSSWGVLPSGREGPVAVREIVFAPSRCMLHRDCREHPDTIGRRCLMDQWDKEWKAGGSK